MAERLRSQASGEPRWQLTPTWLRRHFGPFVSWLQAATLLLLTGAFLRSRTSIEVCVGGAMAMVAAGLLIFVLAYRAHQANRPAVILTVGERLVPGWLGQNLWHVIGALYIAAMFWFASHEQARSGRKLGFDLAAVAFVAFALFILLTSVVTRWRSRNNLPGQS